MEGARLNRPRLRRLLRWLAGGLLLLLLLAFLLPGLLGWFIERQARGWHHVTLDPGVTLAVEEWQRGWFTTRIRGHLQGAVLPLPLVVEVHIGHGPVLPGLAATGRFPLALVSDTLELRSAGGGSNALLLRTEGALGLTGGLWQRLTLLDDASTPVPGGLDLEADLCDGQWLVSGHVPLLGRSVEHMRLQLADLRVQARGKLDAHAGLGAMDAAFSVQALSTDLFRNGIELDDLRLHAVFTPSSEPERADFSFAMSLQRFQSGETLMAPLVLRLQARAVQQKALPHLLQARTQTRLATALAELLPDSELELQRFMMRGNRGWVDAHFRARVGRPAGADWLSLLLAVSGEGEVSASGQWLLGLLERQLRLLQNGQGARLDEIERDAQAAREAEGILRNLVHKGYFAAANGVYKSRIHLQDGALEMNGQAVELLNLMSAP